MHQRPLIVDVCGTLVADDTTLGLLAFHFARQERSWRAALLRAFTSRHSPLRLVAAALERLTGRHIVKHGAVLMLAGDRASDLENSADDYASWLLANRRVASVWHVVEIERVRGCRLVLASASLQPIVAALAGLLGVEFVASTLEQQDGRLTGRYARDLTGIKAQALQGLLGDGFADRPFTAMSDNLTDRELLESAAAAYVVLHREAHRTRWQGLSANYLSVDS